QHVKLIKRDQEEHVELVRRKFNYNSDSLYHIKIVCKGANIDIYIDGNHLFRSQDDRFKSGRIALCGNGPTQFFDIQISTTTDSYENLVKKMRAEEEELKRLRDAYPQPQL